ncbi:hypothetical protein [Polynucleobacter sp. UB-Siik-W21]|uniref:hypothetical protein n=1 Tax=Polynucleobacter sp. UB-Siik-W21 TaxID=1855646 RepID=UPI001BFEB9C9|nr:hypothetical protein [Polynucleobacter sp. UB-Siik-W21]QWD69615.1 hypothetical protein C2756_06720 [Polynucleobacter sp. UB-Siik-W21]
MAEVDKTVPAQIQQRYVRTDTKCTKSSEQSLTGPFGVSLGTVYNPAQGDVNCSSIPIYENIVLNQAQRDAAYQQCRNFHDSNRSSNSILRAGDVMSMNDAKTICTNNGLKEGTAQHTSCILRTVQGR